MPLNALTGEAQQTGSWVFRGVVFLLIGAVAYLSIAVRDRASEQRLSTEVRNAIALSAARHAEVDESLLPLIEDVLAKRQFHPVYQPVYSLTDGDLLGVEALTRFEVEPYLSLIHI